MGEARREVMIGKQAKPADAEPPKPSAPAGLFGRESRADIDRSSVGQPARCMRNEGPRASDLDRRSGSRSSPRRAWSPIPLLTALLVAQTGGCGGSALVADRTNSGTHSSVARAHARQAAAPHGVVPAPPSPRRGRVRPCAAAKIGVALATDRGVYRMGQPVVFTVSARNDAGASCSVPTGSCLPQVMIMASDGAVVWNRAELQVLCTFSRWRRLPPGGTARQMVSWNGEECAGRTPMSCPGGPVSAGSYRVRARWASLTDASRQFVIGG
jgi:hypothetical protein